MPANLQIKKSWHPLPVIGIVAIVGIAFYLFENQRTQLELVDPTGLVVGREYDSEPSVNAAQYHEASRLLSAGENEAAALIYGELTKLEPTRTDAYIGLAGAQARLLQFEQARKNYSRALELQSKNPHALCGLAAVEHSSGDLQLARVLYQQSLDQSPDYLLSRYGMAMVLEELGELELAQKHAKRYLQLAPKSALASEMQRIVDSTE